MLTRVGKGVWETTEKTHKELLDYRKCFIYWSGRLQREKFIKFMSSILWLFHFIALQKSWHVYWNCSHNIEELPLILHFKTRNYAKNITIIGKSDLILKLVHSKLKLSQKYIFKFCSKMCILVCCMLLRVEGALQMLGKSLPNLISIFSTTSKNKRTKTNFLNEQMRSFIY